MRKILKLAFCGLVLMALATVWFLGKHALGMLHKPMVLMIDYGIVILFLMAMTAFAAMAFGINYYRDRVTPDLPTWWDRRIDVYMSSICSVESVGSPNYRFMINGLIATIGGLGITLVLISMFFSGSIRNLVFLLNPLDTVRMEELATERAVAASHATQAGLVANAAYYGSSQTTWPQNTGSLGEADSPSKKDRKVTKIDLKPNKYFYPDEGMHVMVVEWHDADGKEISFDKNICWPDVVEVSHPKESKMGLVRCDG